MGGSSLCTGASDGFDSLQRLVLPWALMVMGHSSFKRERIAHAGSIPVGSFRLTPRPWYESLMAAKKKTRGKGAPKRPAPPPKNVFAFPAIHRDPSTRLRQIIGGAGKIRCAVLIAIDENGGIHQALAASEDPRPFDVTMLVGEMEITKHVLLMHATRGDLADLLDDINDEGSSA